MNRESDPNLGAGIAPGSLNGNTGGSEMSELSAKFHYTKRRPAKTLVVFQWFVIILAGSGFVFKFIEFFDSIIHSEDQAVNFAMTPLAMYVGVALGFFLLFLWSILRGDYKDIELPKYRLFEREMLAEIEEARYNREHSVKAAGSSAIGSVPIFKN